MRIVLLGAPGAGKGTQAEKISEIVKIPHISTGDILRSEIKRGTPLGKKADEYVRKGTLVPDEVIIEIIRGEINRGGSKDGFLLDGFPRNLKQAAILSNMMNELGLKLNKVVNIVVNSDEAVKRLSSRRICINCKRIYRFNNSQSGNINRCPKCGGKLIKRKDDNIDVIKKRLEIYESETKPLINYYRDKGLLININGTGTEQEITERILKQL